MNPCVYCGKEGIFGTGKHAECVEAANDDMDRDLAAQIPDGMSITMQVQTILDQAARDLAAVLGCDVQTIHIDATTYPNAEVYTQLRGTVTPPSVYQDIPLPECKKIVGAYPGARALLLKR